MEITALSKGFDEPVWKTKDVDGKPLRYVEVNGETYLSGIDLSAIMGSKRPQKSLHNHVDEKNLQRMSRYENGKYLYNMVMVNRVGAYQIFLKAKNLVNGRNFGEWLIKEMLSGDIDISKTNIIDVIDMGMSRA